MITVPPDCAASWRTQAGRSRSANHASPAPGHSRQCRRRRPEGHASHPPWHGWPRRGRSRGGRRATIAERGAGRPAPSHPGAGRGRHRFRIRPGDLARSISPAWRCSMACNAAKSCSARRRAASRAGSAAGRAPVRVSAGHAPKPRATGASPVRRRRRAAASICRRVCAKAPISSRGASAGVVISPPCRCAICMSAERCCSKAARTACMSCEQLGRARLALGLERPCARRSSAARRIALFRRPVPARMQRHLPQLIGHPIDLAGAGVEAQRPADIRKRERPCGRPAGHRGGGTDLECGFAHGRGMLGRRDEAGGAAPRPDARRDPRSAAPGRISITVPVEPVCPSASFATRRRETGRPAQLLVEKSIDCTPEGAMAEPSGKAIGSARGGGLRPCRQPGLELQRRHAVIIHGAPSQAQGGGIVGIRRWRSRESNAGRAVWN